MKTKALISFAVTAKLICVFVFAYADCWFSHDAAHVSGLVPVTITMVGCSNGKPKSMISQRTDTLLSDYHQMIWPNWSTHLNRNSTYIRPTNRMAVRRNLYIMVVLLLVWRVSRQNEFLITDLSF